jgi:hypothetical protein
MCCELPERVPMRPIYDEHLNSDAAARRIHRNYAECHTGVRRLMGCDFRSDTQDKTAVGIMDLIWCTR